MHSIKFFERDREDETFLAYFVEYDAEQDNLPMFQSYFQQFIIIRTVQDVTAYKGSENRTWCSEFRENHFFIQFFYFNRLNRKQSHLNEMENYNMKLN